MFCLDGLTADGFPCPGCGKDGEHVVMRMDKDGVMILHCMTCERAWEAQGGEKAGSDKG